MFVSLASEAAGESQERRIRAKTFLTELGAYNSSRLLLGGLLADLMVEHYAWTLTADKANPDTTTVDQRADSFIHRVHVLYEEGMILTLPDTYTGLTLEFLRNTSHYRFGRRVQWVGIGDWTKDADSRKIIKAALDRVRVVVANMKEY